MTPSVTSCGNAVIGSRLFVKAFMICQICDSGVVRLNDETKERQDAFLARSRTALQCRLAIRYVTRVSVHIYFWYDLRALLRLATA